MRTIKFEVIDLDKKEVIGYESYHQSFGWTHVLMDGKLDEGSRPVHVGVISDTLKNLVRRQYTGMNNKDGKEIYEKDVVSMIEDVIIEFIGGHPRTEPEAKFKEVKFIDGVYVAGVHYLWEIAKECEVMGNAYENPELLSDTEQATEAKPLL